MSNDADVGTIRRAAYGRNYSYFSHRIFVTYLPEDFHRYLFRLMKQDGDLADERIDMELLRWVLLHKSQLNALALNRQIEAMRGDEDTLKLPEPGRLRTDIHFRTEISLQFALEIELAMARDSHLVQERPRLQLALLDAAYYVSRLRADIDEPPENADATRVDIDLSRAGRAAFAAYLETRMNLHEDRAPNAATDIGSTPSPLSEEEIDWLMGVAIGVARTLSSSASGDDLKKRWSEALASRWKERELPLPDQTLFDALLVGKSSPLIELRPASSGQADEKEEFLADSLQFQWRDSKFPVTQWAKSIRGIANASRQLVDAVRRVNTQLSPAMLGTSRDPQDTMFTAQAPLGLLSDQYRVLPTTPAWSVVASAADRMQLASKGLGDLQTLHSDRKVLMDYVRLLLGEHASRSILLALGIGAMLEGLSRNSWNSLVSGDRPAVIDENSWQFGLSLLRDGLRLFDADLPTARARLEATATGLRQIVALPEVLFGETRRVHQELRMDALKELMSSCFSNAAAFPAVSEDIRQRAEESLKNRLQELARHGASQPFLSADELGCTASRAGVHADAPVLLANAGCRTWTRLLLSALNELRLGVQGNRVNSLAVIAALALERLGIGALSTTSRRLLLEALPIPESQVEVIFRSIPLATSKRAAVGSNRFALVVCSSPSTVAERWKTPPQTCFVLALSEQELESQNRQALESLGRSLDVAARVALEPQVGEPRRIAEHFGVAKFDLVWIREGSQPSTDKRSVFAPDSADELWSV